MEKSTDLGELEQLALGAVARVGKSACGSAIQDELSRALDRDVSVATVYLTLVQLEGQGLVRSAGVEDGLAGSIGTRLLEITSSGREALDPSRVPPVGTGEGEGPE